MLFPLEKVDLYYISYIWFIRDVTFIFLIASLFMFFLSVLSVLVNSSNYFRILFCLEIMFVSLSVFFISISLLGGSPFGFIMAIILITLSAIEAAVALSILLNVYYYKYDVKVEEEFFFKN